MPKIDPATRRPSLRDGEGEGVDIDFTEDYAFIRKLMFKGKLTTEQKKRLKLIHARIEVAKEIPHTSTEWDDMGLAYKISNYLLTVY